MVWRTLRPGAEGSRWAASFSASRRSCGMSFSAQTYRCAVASSTACWTSVSTVLTSPPFQQRRSPLFVQRPCTPGGCCPSSDSYTYHHLHSNPAYPSPSSPPLYPPPHSPTHTTPTNPRNPLRHPHP